jgi:ribosome-associated protein
MLPCWSSPAPGRCGAQFREDDVLSHSDPTTGLPVGPRAARVTASAAADAGTYTAEDVLAAVLKSVDDDKAEDIVQIDLRGRSDVADYMVICSGRSSRQVAAISEKLVDRLKQDLRIISKIEGKETGDWVLIDAGDVIVHVFRPEVREFYQLEKMWLPGSAHRGA